MENNNDQNEVRSILFELIQKPLTYITTGMEFEGLCRKYPGSENMKVWQFLNLHSSDELYVDIEYLNGMCRFSVYKASNYYAEFGCPVIKEGYSLKRAKHQSEMAHLVGELDPELPIYDDIIPSYGGMITVYGNTDPDFIKRLNTLVRFGYIMLKYRGYYVTSYVWYYNQDIERHFSSFVGATGSLGSVFQSDVFNIELGKTLVANVDEGRQTTQLLDYQLAFRMEGDKATFYIHFGWYSWGIEDEPFLKVVVPDKVVPMNKIGEIIL